MDRLINYGGGNLNKPIFPTSNSEYGRGVLASLRKASGGSAKPSMTFDPAATNYYIPQQTTGSGAQTQGQQYMMGSSGHVHAPNCPNFATGSTSYGTPGNFDSQGQSAGLNKGSGTNNMTNSTDHIEVLQGDAAQAYLAQQNDGQPAYQFNYQTSDQANVSEAGNHVGMTGSFQNIQNGSGDSGNVATNTQAVVGGGAKRQGMSGAGDFVKVNGLPMDRNPRWRQSNPTIPHVYSAVKSRNNPIPTYKLCGKCPKCKTIQDPSTFAPSTINFKEQGLTSTGSRRFPLPRAIKVQSSPKGPKAQGQGQVISGGLAQGISLPIQGSNVTMTSEETGLQPHQQQ